MTKKKKYTYPDGGKLVTGTPEYQEYIAQQQRYKDWENKHNTLLSSGYGKPYAASKADLAAITPRLVNFNTSASGYNVYTYDPNKVNPSAAPDEYFDSASGKYYVPYYDKPADVEIVKSEAELLAEQKKAEADAIRQQYQGEVSEVVYNPQTGQNEIVKKQIPVGTDITDYVGSGKYKAYADGGNFDASTLASLASAIPQQNTQMYGDQMQGNQMYEGLKSGVKAIPVIGQVAGAFDAVSQAIPGLASNLTNDPMKGATIAEGFSDPFKAQMKLMQNDDATNMEKALGLLPQTAGFLNYKIAKRVENEDNKQNFLNKTYATGSNFNLPTYPNGGSMNLPITYGNVTIDADPTNAPVEFNSPFYSTPRDYDAMLNYVGVPFGKTPTSNQMNAVRNILPVHQSSNENLYQIFSGDNKEQQMNDFYNQQNQIWSNNQSKPVSQYGCGGKMKKMAEGGFIEYSGPSHEGGGVDIDQNGSPTNQQNAVAEVEGGESMHDDGIEKYIFSDRLMLDPKEKITFADASKKINNKYKDVETDKFQKEARDIELNRLKQEQEMFKQSISGQHQMPNGRMMSNSEMMAYGGKMKYPNGGLLPIPEKDFSNFYLNNSPYNTPTQTTPYSSEYLNSIGYGSDNINVTEPNDKSYLNEQYTIYDESGNPTQQRSSRLQQIMDNPFQKQSATEEGLPQDKINPLGFAASNIGNIYDLYQSNKPIEKNKFGYVDLSGIDLSAQRRELEKQSSLQKATNRENVRSTATSSGQALTNQIIGNALAASALGSGLSQSYLNEQTANTQINNQEILTNAQIKQQEILADQMDKANRQSVSSQALHSIGQNTQGYVRDLKSAEVGNTNNQMWFDAIKTGKYTKLGFDANGKQVIMLHDGRVVSQP